MGKQTVYLSALRLDDGELLILASSQQPEDALNLMLIVGKLKRYLLALKAVVSALKAPG